VGALAMQTHARLIVGHAVPPIVVLPYSSMVRSSDVVSKLDMTHFISSGVSFLVGVVLVEIGVSVVGTVGAAWHSCVWCVCAFCRCGRAPIDPWDSRWGATAWGI
jgi:hypothetical protein